MEQIVQPHVYETRAETLDHGNTSRTCIVK